jgi:hypothetical protein
MLTICSVILYGGLFYYVSIAQKWDMAVWFHKFKLSFVVTTWQKGPEGRLMVVAGFIALLIIIEALIVGVGGGAGPSEPPPQGEWVPGTGSTTVSDHTNEGQTTSLDPGLHDQNVVSANITLTWTDDDVAEPGPGVTPIAPTNQPDTFRLFVFLADGTQYADAAANDPTSRQGEIRITVPVQVEGNLSGWAIQVDCEEAGDVVGPFGRVWATDNGNAWDLAIEYTYLEWVVPEA